jgi:putative tryptophan/tyrosine transport system substrate-binding protein
MRRREFITLLGGATAVWPLAAWAQHGGRMRRIGWLNTDTVTATARLNAFKRGLADLGWNEGPSLVFSEFRPPRAVARMNPHQGI